MLATLNALFSLFLSYGVLLMANGLFSTLLGVRSRLEGFDPQVTGLIMGAYFAGLLGGALTGAHVVNRVGHIRCFAAAASVMSITALLHVIWVDPVAWALMRVVAGFSMAGMIMVTESWLNARAANAVRGQVLALYMITNYFCAGLGQFLLPLADPGEFYLFSLVSILLSLALIPVLLTRSEAPTPVPPQKGGFKDVYAIAPLALIGAGCSGAVNAAFHGMGPVYATAVGLSNTQTSAFMAAAIFGGLLLQWPMGYVSDRIDRRFLLGGAALIVSAICTVFALLTPEGGLALFLLPAGYGAVAYTVYSICVAHANDRATTGQSVRVAGAMLMSYGTGAAFGPVVAGASMSALGPAGLFWQSALVTGALGIYTIYRLLVRPERPVNGPFVPMPAAQYTSKELVDAVREDTTARRDKATQKTAAERDSALR